jgi:hypothetical protein
MTARLDAIGREVRAGGTALAWTFCREVDVSLEEAQATLAALVLLAGDAEGERGLRARGSAQPAGLERPCELIVAWARTA